MKKIIAIASVAAAAVAAGMVNTTRIDGSMDGEPIVYPMKVVAVQIACATNGCAFSIGLTKRLDKLGLKGNVAGTNSVIAAGTFEAGVTNVALASPMYVVPGDEWSCSGVASTNGTACAIVFTE